MGRPPLPLGTYGKIRVYPHGGGFRAITSYRDYDGTTRPVERHATTKSAARGALTLALRDRTRSQGSDDLTPVTTVAVLAHLWWTEISTTAGLSPGTLRLYRDRLDRQILPALGNLRIRELTTGTIDRHLRAVTKTNGPGTAKAVRSGLGGLCTLACRHDALERNPVRDAGPIPKPQPKPPAALTLTEARQLRALLTYDHKAIERDLPDFVDMMLATGLRIGECSALTWTDLNLRAATVAITGIVVRVRGHGLIIKRDDSNKLTTRTLDLPTWATTMLTRRRTAAAGGSGGEPDPDQPVFPAPQGGLRDPSNTQADLRDAFTTAGYTITSHTLRKTVATLMDTAGLTPTSTADQLGHAKPSMTQDHYYARHHTPTGANTILENLA
jgi:integrase